jgi:hypothetical protein
MEKLMANTAFIGLETATSLLVAYESLALSHKKALRLEETSAEFGERDANEHVNYQNTFALLIINAAIIEGTLRSILSGRILNEINSIVEERKSKGATSPTKAEMLLSKYHVDIEAQGGWEKIKEQYAFYFDISLDSFMGEELREAINVLFTLRNVLAHGTAIVSPKEKMDDSEKELYPYAWQRKLQRTSVYLEKEFKGGDVFKNLAKHDVPEHFMTKTKELFDKVETALSPLPSNSQVTIDMLKRYSFGFVHFTR